MCLKLLLETMMFNGSNIDLFLNDLSSSLEILNKLKELDNIDEFISELLLIAKQRNFTITNNEVFSKLSSHSDTQKDLFVDPQEYVGWLPSFIKIEDNEPVVIWYYFGETLQESAFFYETIKMTASKAFNKLFLRKTSLDFLEKFYTFDNKQEPSGFIFHSSRCGSTLVGNMFKILPNIDVFSEPPAIDNLLQLPFKYEISQEKLKRIFKALIYALGHKRYSSSEHFFIKTDCWHTLKFSLFQEAFPDTPIMFLYREPQETLLSHKKIPGIQTVPNLIEPKFFGLEENFLDYISVDEYGAFIIGEILKAGCFIKQESTSLIINYRDLLESLKTKKLLEFFGITVDEKTFKKLIQESSYYSKDKTKTFSNKNTDEQSIDAQIIKSSKKWMEKYYLELEQL